MQTKQNDKIRNIAIIAHVDHGKTTLVDFMLRQSGSFGTSQGRLDSLVGLSACGRDSYIERVMDSMDLERERGITIASKNCSVQWKGVKINIIDTPGHSDFGGEVERGLKMVDGALLLVDASEGPLPQTRFVLRKALEARLKIIVLINKIDRKDARPQKVLEEIYNLFIDLDANDSQIEFPILYTIGRNGIAQKKLQEKGKDLTPLFEAILEKIPPPSYITQEPFQMLVTNLSYSDYVGRLAIGRVFNGSVKKSDGLVCLGKEGQPKPLRVSSLQVYDGIRLQEAEEVTPGDIIILSGIEEVEIGDTICTAASPKTLKRITVDEPTVSMKFMINTSPFAGREGKIVQSRKIFERLQKETLHNVALHLESGENKDSFVIKGRGEFQMSILIEIMRREGFELSVGRPEVIFKEQNGVRLEPIEHLFIDCHEEFMGIVTEKIYLRLGRMINMINHPTTCPAHKVGIAPTDRWWGHGSGRIRLEFSIPSRGLIGYRSQFLTDTKGMGLMNSYLMAFEPYRGDMKGRTSGVLVSDRQGVSVSYALFHLEPRGILFIEPGVPVYKGMIVGEHNRENDLRVNPCKEKKLSNMRAAGRDENIILSPVLPMTLERAIEFVKEDEQIEVTPKSIRLRKNIL